MTDGGPPPDLVAPRIGALRSIVLHGELDAAMDLSGVAAAGDYLALGADEGHQLQILQRDPGGESWTLRHRLALAKQDQEADIEAIAYGAGYLYLAGSHSMRRRRLKPELSLRKNRERLLTVEGQDARNRLYRIAFDPSDGRLGELEHVDLSKRLRRDPLLGPFTRIPGKENGVDIEGITCCRDGVLYLGFRGPVLRGNYIPVMTLRFERPKDYALEFVCLDGQGIRDMTALGNGFLILAGPVNDAAGSYHLWWWDGLDQIPGRGREVRPACLLGEVSTPGGAKAEGLAVLEETADHAEVIVVYETGTTAQAVGMRVDLSGLDGTR